MSDKFQLVSLNTNNSKASNQIHIHTYTHAYLCVNYIGNYNKIKKKKIKNILATKNYQQFVAKFVKN